MTLSELRKQEAHFSADGEPRQARQFAFSFIGVSRWRPPRSRWWTVLSAAPLTSRTARLACLHSVLSYWALMFVGGGERPGLSDKATRRVVPNWSCCFRPRSPSRLRAFAPSWFIISRHE